MPHWTWNTIAANVGWVPTWRWGICCHNVVTDWHQTDIDPTLTISDRYQSDINPSSVSVFDVCQGIYLACQKPSGDSGIRYSSTSTWGTFIRNSVSFGKGVAVACGVDIWGFIWIAACSVTNWQWGPRQTPNSGVVRMWLHEDSHRMLQSHSPIANAWSGHWMSIISNANWMASYSFGCEWHCTHDTNIAWHLYVTWSILCS